MTQNGCIFQVVCTAIVLWDHLSTFDLEVELIWKKKWSLVQLLYFVNRYVGGAAFIYATNLLLWVPDPAFLTICPSFGKVQTWLSITTLGAMQGIMVHRIISMYRHERKILICLLAAFALEFTACVIMGSFSITRSNFPVIYNQTLRTCIPSIPAWFPALWYMMMVFDLAIFILAVWEGMRFARESRARARSPETSEIFHGTRWMKERSLLRVLLRDSIVFPFIGLLMCVFNSLAWYKLPLGALQYTMNIQAAGYPILGCRLILNLRESYYQPFAEEVAVSTKSMPQFTPDYTPQLEQFEMPTTISRTSEGILVSLPSTR